MNFYVYEYSLDYAKRNNELEQWSINHALNIKCKDTIEKAIALHTDPMNLLDGASTVVREKFGYDRLNWVLANTIQHNKNADGFSFENKEWSKKFFFDRSKSKDRTKDFIVKVRPEVLERFVNQARQEYKALNLFDHTHCLPDDHEQNYEGKVVVISPQMLEDEYKSPDYQLFVPTHGNGCRPHAIGRSVSGQFLKDGESNTYWRQDIIGILDEKYLPDWAKEKLAEHEQSDESPDESEDAGMSMQ